MMSDNFHHLGRVCPLFIVSMQGSLWGHETGVVNSHYLLLTFLLFLKQLLLHIATLSSFPASFP